MSFYTGLVADLYRPLRGLHPDPEIYARFIARHGEPALELGCGDGDPILALRAQGLDVDGLDISPDMVERARARAREMGVDVRLFVQSMESMDLPRRYRAIYLAGATFNLLPDDDAAGAALRRIRKHLEADGCALVSIFIPTPLAQDELGRWREDTDGEGRKIRFTTVSQSRDDTARTLTSTLRYERAARGADEVLERDLTIHWYTPAQFAALAADAGLAVVRRLPDDDAATAVAFWLAPQ